MSFGVPNEQLLYINTPGKVCVCVCVKFYSLEHKLILGRENNFLHLNENIYTMFNIFVFPLSLNTFTQKTQFSQFAQIFKYLVSS